MISESFYFPSLKTNQSELRAVANLSTKNWQGITPIFELTRSRKTSKEPEGSATRRAEQLAEVFNGHQFLLDLTTEDDLISPDIDALFDDTNGYGRWIDFVSSNLPETAIACLQYLEDGEPRHFIKQAERLLDRQGHLGLRVQISDVDTREIVDLLANSVGLDKLILMVNLGHIRQNEQHLTVSGAEEFIRNVLPNRVPERLLFCGSSFPRAVGAPPYGEDGEGTFPAYELSIFNSLVGRYRNLNLAHSDFGSVHPIRYETRGGAWVPRIDLPLGDSIAYERRRRHDGGYIAAAKEIVRVYGKQLPDCWGTDQIRSAGEGKLAGASPSFWISVRINIWITSVRNRLEGVFG